MKNKEIFSLNGKKPESPTLFFEEEYNRMAEMSGALDELYWDIEKEGINTHVVRSINETVNRFYDELSRLFKMEEDILFKELREILPERALADALMNENSNILLLFEALKNIFSENDEIRKEKDLLQAEMIALADLLQRDAAKKKNVLIKEINTVLPRQKLDEMREKIKEGFFVHA
ncbi:MAG TPA: hemerythrin domain-containing protein [Ignavibacteria bacterium]|nr:hemerythrin domain-containing protein [Ignavibacteria bacterium]